MGSPLTSAIANQKRMQSVTTVTGYTQASTIPFSLMFGQPNNSAKFNLKMESIQDLSSGMMEILAERSNALNFVLTETLTDIKAMFSFDSSLAYDITAVPYTRLANVRLQNIIGLKSNIYDYAKKLNSALDLSMNILENELAGLTKLVAQLLAERDALQSNRPVSAVVDLKMHTTDVDKLKTDLSSMIGHEASNQYIEFGAIYFSLAEWKDCNRLVLNISQRLKKVKLEKFAKDIKNLTALMDKLIMRMEGEGIPKANVRDYSMMIEQTSNNIAFAGATVHMCQTLVQTINNHNEVLRVEVDDYKKHHK